MNIIEALKSKNVRRIDNMRRWLVWDEDRNAWVVYGQEYAQKYARVIVITEDEEEAITWLLYKEDELPPREAYPPQEGVDKVPGGM